VCFYLAIEQRYKQTEPMPKKQAAKPLCFDQSPKSTVAFEQRSGVSGLFRRAALEDTVATREVCAPERRQPAKLA